jgi:hypothetical protein
VEGTTGLDPSAFQFNLNLSADELNQDLNDRLNIIDNPTDGLLKRIEDPATGLEVRVFDVEEGLGNVEADYTALVDPDDPTSLESRVSATASVTTSNSASISGIVNTSIPGLDGRLTDLDDITDPNSALSRITANASAITSLESSIGALDAEGGETWEFDTDVQSFVGSSATATWDNGVLVWTPTGADPQLQSPTISLTGGIYTQVVARIRQTGVGGTWQGRVYYTTAGHGRTDSYYKEIDNPSFVINEWQTLTWDMSDLTVGGTDWFDSQITRIDFDLVSDAGGEFEFDWIQIARFSVTAVTSAIDAVVVRVEVNEGTIESQGTIIEGLDSIVNNETTGVSATAQALNALTTTVTDNKEGTDAQAQRISALETTVDNETTGVTATAGIVENLQTDVSSNTDGVEAATSAILQLRSSVEGGLSSVVNPLTVAGENYGTTFAAGEIVAFNALGGRQGVSAKVATDTNVADYIYRADGSRIFLQPTDIYEVRCRVYHDRPTNAGSFYIGMHSYADDSTGTYSSVEYINDGVVTTSTTNSYWMKTAGSVGANAWQDIVVYILGPEADPTECPALRVNGSTDNPGGYTFYADGLRATGPYIRLRVLNYNGSGYGDSSTTTLYVTDFQVSRINGSGELYAALQVESSTRATDLNEVTATYTVKAELNSGGQPYVTGFGLMSSIINDAPTSAFGIRADQFFIARPDDPADTIPPFVAGDVDGTYTIGIDGQLIIDGTIYASSIVAASIGGRELNVDRLSAVSGNMGTLIAGL